MQKKDPTRFTIRFDPDDPIQAKVAQVLTANCSTRSIARYIADAIVIATQVECSCSDVEHFKKMFEASETIPSYEYNTPEAIAERKKAKRRKSASGTKAKETPVNNKTPGKTDSTTKAKVKSKNAKAAKPDIVVAAPPVVPNMFDADHSAEEPKTPDLLVPDFDSDYEENPASELQRGSAESLSTEKRDRETGEAEDDALAAFADGLGFFG